MEKGSKKQVVRQDTKEQVHEKPYKVSMHLFQDFRSSVVPKHTVFDVKPVD